MTSSTDFLVDHAYRNVWCAPGQDRQHIVGPARMTQPWGVIGSMRIGMRGYNLPTPSDWYHVFMIGDLPPILVGMDQVVDKWVSARAHCVATSLLVDIYFNDGVHFPLHRAYFLYTSKGALVVALKKTDIIKKMDTVQPWVRWRSNAWFDSAEANIQPNTGIEVDGLTYGDVNEFNLFQNRWRLAQTKQGYAWAFVNGRRVRDINTATAKPGDICEYVRDASVKEVKQMKLTDLPTFDSIRDNQNKFLLPRPGLGDVIDFEDDVDLYLLRYTKPALYTGIYVHQNQEDAIRMVTHRDYATPTAYLHGLVNDNFGWRWSDDLRIEVIVRHSGFRRDLIDEAHRIKELFKLPEDLRLKAMIGVDSEVSVWRAAELENSPYLRIMEASYDGLDRQIVEDAYGYNAISRLIGDTPVRLDVNAKWVDLPFSLYARSTVLEYDELGTLLGWYQHDISIQYPVRNATCRYIEAYIGRGGVGLSTIYGKKTAELVDGVDYRFYLCTIWNGEPRDDWKDVTGDDTKYEIVDGVLTWLIDTTKYYTAVRGDRDFLMYELDLDYRDDLITLTVRADEVVKGAVATSGVMDIPPGEIMLWVNKRPVIENIDYYVKWPEICIVNKAYLVEGPIQNVVLMARGFPNADFERDTPSDVGFVAYGKISHNARFNIRDDKVCRIVAGGQLYTRDEVAFSEDQGGELDAPNGSPYAVYNPIIPMAGVTNTETYALRAKAQLIDDEIEDYLTQKLPEPVEPNPNPIPAWYPVFSPFCAKLIYDMLYGVLPMDEFKGDYTLAFVKQRLQGYDWILPYDPALDANLDSRYVVIHPHPEQGVIELNVYQYRLLDRAIQVFLNNNVQFNRTVVIVEEGFEHDMRDHPHPHQTWESVGQ